MNTKKPWRNIDLLGTILSFCNPDEVLHLRLVNSEWRNVIDRPEIWKNILFTQLIPPNFVDQVLKARTDQHGTPNLSDKERYIMNSVLFGRKSSIDGNPKEVV